MAKAMTTRRDLLKKSLLGCAAAALSAPLSGLEAGSQYGIKGRRAPELQVDYWIDGSGAPTNFRLGDHDGKWIFLKCFQSWCPGCHSHGFPALKIISDGLADNPAVAIAGIQTVFEGHYTNTVDKVREIQLRYDLRIPMGHDPGPEHGHPMTMIDYRTGGTPWMILIDPQRRVMYNDYGIDAARAVEFLRRQTG